MSASSRKQVKEKVIGKLEAALDILYHLWEEIGIDETQKGKRAGTVAIHLCNLLDEMVSEEQQMHDEMGLNIQRYVADLSALCLEMNLPAFEVSEQLSMVQKEKELRMKLDSVKREKQERMSRLKQLLDEDEAVCQALCATPFYLCQHTVPTQHELQQLEAHIAGLQAEKEKRHKEFVSTKKKVLALCSEIDYKPETSLEQDLICEDDDAVQLTKEHMTSVENILRNLEEKNQQLQQEAEDLWTRIHSLWDRIDVGEDERAEFSCRHSGHCSRVVSGLRAEVHRCEQLKHSNLSHFVEGLRKEIADWWDRCHYNKKHRDAFTPYHDELYTEELLQLHEQELKRLQDYYRAHQALLDLIAKRDKLWKNMVEFEKAASDPQRFFNDRGGKFLKEEKARNKLVKELPKLEEDVKEEIERWEQAHGQQFLVEGVTYQLYGLISVCVCVCSAGGGCEGGDRELEEDVKEEIERWEQAHGQQFLVEGVTYQVYVDQQWAHLRQQKEQEKEERHKNRAKQMEEEMTYGSKPTPNTPVKRRFGNTPNSTPLKARKVLGENSVTIRVKVEFTQVDENPRTPSAVGRAAHSRQPLSVMKQPNTNKAMNTLRRRSVRQARKCLRRSMQKASASGEAVPKGTAKKPQPDMFSRTTVSRSDDAGASGSGSIATTGSYHEFAKGLNQTARPNCRSSVAPGSVSSPHRPR
ncbi:hypothetical protein ACOMHN_035820 [Nucella lapillus]